MEAAAVTEAWKLDDHAGLEDSVDEDEDEEERGRITENLRPSVPEVIMIDTRPQVFLSER